MKRKLATLFVLLCSAFLALGFASCQIIQWRPDSGVIDQYDRYTLELDTSEYDPIVPYGGKFNYQSVKIVYKAYVGENQEVFYQTKFSLKENMVTGGLDTSSIGQKELIIEYGGERFTLPYTVKYQVDFLSKGEVFNRQFVFNADEVVIPEAKVQEGFTFAYWKSEVPDVLTGNLSIEAHYYNNSLHAPALETIDCTYDPNATIASLTLPSNENGKWEFVEAPTTLVGEVGEHKFEVRFLSSTNEIVPVENNFVTVRVAKKEIAAPAVSASLVYNGTTQKATVTDVEKGYLPYDVLNEGGVDAGKYFVTATLKDLKNYKWKDSDACTSADESTGVLTFEYTIAPKQVQFVIISDEFTYNREEQFPTYRFQDNFDNEHITAADVTVTGTPQINADTYKYGFAMSNPNFVGSCSGTFTIVPKELTFIVQEESFVYDGTEHYPIYSFADPEDTPIVYVMSGKSQTEVGDYRYGWLVMDDNYTGMHTGTFNITKPDVTVTAVLAKTEITYPADVPEITFQVDGFTGDVSLLKITAEKPSATVGTYVITPVVNNDNVNATCISATLTIKKGEATFYKPTLSTDGLSGTAAVYGEKISTVTFSDEGFGSWAWKNPDLIIDKMSDFSAIAVFTPQNPNLNQLEAEFYITNEYRQIEKRLLDIVVTKNEYIYTGDEFALEYHLVDTLRPESYTIDLSKLTVSGNVAETEAGAHSKRLEIVSDYYKGIIDCKLCVQKADVAVTLASNEATLKFAPDMTLETSGIPLGGSAIRTNDNKPVSGTYTWEEPTFGLYMLTIGEETPVKVVFTPDDENNYNVGFATFNFTIIKADSKIQKLEGSDKLDLAETYTKVFDNQKYTFIATVNRAVAGDYPSFTYVYTDSNGRVVDEVIEAGRYKLTIVATETAHYNGAEETVNVVVTQASNNWGSATQEQLPYIVSTAWTYKENAATINAAAVWGLSTLTIEYKNTTTGTVYQNQLPIDAQAGEYTATVRIPETSNWTGLESTITFTIRKGSVDIPTVAFESNNTKNVAYNGNVQRPAVNGTYTDGDVNGVAYTVVYRTPSSMDKGTYYVTLTLVDDVNYVWNGEVGACVEVDYSITTATNEITSLVMTGWAYKGYEADVNSPSIAAKFGMDTVEYTYYRDASCTMEISLTDLKNAGVGTYYVKASIAAAANGNYTSAEKVQSFKIVESEWTGNTFEKVYEITWSNGLTLADIELDAHYTWDAPETVLIAGSVDSYAATYKIDNYLPVHGFFEVTVHKIAGVVSAQNKTFTYGANTFTLDENKVNEELNLYLGVSTNHVDDANSISYEISYKANEGVEAESVTTIVNAGVYTITVKLTESEHYAAATTTVILTINKVQNTQAILAMKATYGDDLNEAKDAYGKTLADYNDAYGEWSWETSGTVGDAGTKTYTAKYTPKAEYAVNYAGRTGVEVTITVERKTIALPTLTTSFVYNGNEQKPVVESSEYYTISWTNENSENVGEYSVTLTLISANYAWSGSGAVVDGLDAAYRYAITKATLSVRAEMQQIAIYGDKVSEKLTLPVSTFNGSSVGVWSWSNVTAETTVGNVGERYFVATCVLSGDDANNFYSVNDVTVTVTVNRATSTIFVQDHCSKVYDGTAFAFAAGEVIPSHGEDATIKYSYQVGETVVSGLPTNVGRYQVTVTLGESANYASSNTTVTVEITKATNGWAAQAPSIADRTYGEGEFILLLPELKYHDEDTTATVTYTHKTKTNVSYTNTLPVNALAGEYSVTIFVTGSDNWLDFEDDTLSFEIKKAEITLPTLTTTFVYNGNVQKPVVESSDYYTISSWTDKHSTNVDAYSVTLTLISDNYAWSGNIAVVDELNATYSYAITKAQAEHIHLSSVQMEDWTYGDDAKTPSATAATFVTIKYRYEQRNGENWVATTEVVNAGSYRVQAYVVETNNYVSVESAWKEFIVEKKLVESVDTITGFVYDGNTTRTPIVNDGFTMTFSKNGVSVDVAKDAGEYKVVVAAKANYTLAASVTKEYTFTISPAQVSVRVTDGTFTYDGTEKSATIAFSGDTLPSDTDYTIANNKGTDANEYKFTVTLNNNYIFEDETRTKELRFVIEKATWSGNTPEREQNFTKVWHTGLTLAEFTLPNGYAWEDATTTLVPGTETAQYYPVVYTHLSGNYEPITLNDWATVQVLKAKVDISTTLKGNAPEYDSSKAYTVTDLMNVTITTENGETLTATDFVWTWTIDGGPADSITNAGTYSVNAALTREKSAYYKINTTSFVVATIEKAKAPIPGTITASVGATLQDLTIPVSEYGVWTFVKPTYTLTTTGDYHVDVHFTPSEAYSQNYAEYDAKLHISVGKTVVNTTVTTTSANYTGSDISVSINVKTGDDVLAASTDYTYVVKHGDNTIATNNTSNFIVREAGTYTIELMFTVLGGYSWNSADGTVSGNTLIKTFVIGKATNAWTQTPAIDKGNAFTYGTAYEATAEATFGSVQITYYQGETKLTEKPVNAGEYKVHFFVEETTNYLELSETISYTIQKQTIEKPVISDENVTYLSGRASILPNHVTTDTYTVAWTVDSPIAEDTRVNGVDVGSYTITISLKDTANYAWADGSAEELTATYTINPATATLSLSDNTDLVYNRAEHTVSVIVTANGSTLMSGYTVSGNTATNAGTHTVTVTLTNANYVFADNAITATATFTIAKAVNQQTIPAMTVTYGDNLNNAKTADGKKLSDFNDTYGTWSWETATVGNAGTKTFTANYTPTDTDNYESRTLAITVTVKKAANDVTLSVTGKTYDGTAVSGALTADNKEGASTYTYSGRKADGTTVSGESFPTEAGTYIVTVTIAESANYLEGTATSKEFTITPATATMRLDKTSFVYDGTEHTVSVIVTANGSTLTSGYTVSGDKATNAGTHTVTVTLTNANYVFENGANTATYTITPKAIAPTLSGANNLTYTGSEQTVTLNPAEGYTVACVGSKTTTVVNGYEIKVTNADSYTVTLTLTNGNYTWSETLASGWAKHEDGTLTRTFTVEAKAINVPTLSQNTFTYNGSVQKPDVATSADYDIAYENATSTNAGNYNVTLTLKNENYKWNDTQNGLTRTLTYSIEKAIVNVVSLAQSEFTYTGEPVELVYTVETMGGAPLTLGSDYTTSNNIATNVGSHSFTITLSGNYKFVNSSNGSSDDSNTTTLNYTIKKADVTVTLTLNNYAWTYGQYNADTNTLSATATKAFKDDVTVKYRYSTNGDAASILSSFTPNTQNAGTYYVQAYVEGGDNYNGSTSAWTAFTIAKVQVDVSGLALEDKLGDNALTYTGENQLPVTAGDKGLYTLTINDALDSSAMGVNVGKYVVKLALKDTTNYEWSTPVQESYTYEIKPATATLSLDNKSFVFDGTEHTVSVIVTANGSTLTSKDYTVSGNTATEVGTHTVTVTLTNTNYAFADGTNTATAKFTIAKAAVKYDGQTSFEVTYGATFEELELPTSDYGTWAFEKEGLIGDASDTPYTFTVKFTPKEEYEGDYGAATQTVTIKVNKATNNVTLTVTGKTYDGTAVSGTLNATNPVGATYTYSGTKVNGTKVNGKGFPTEAGTYTVTVIIPTSTNYLEGKATSNEFTISQAEMTITMKTEYNEMWREGLTLNSLKPADTENGAYEWTNATVGLDASLNVGSYTLQLVYTPKDSNNYKTLTKDVTVNVTPKLIDLPTLSVSKFTYNGSVQKPDVAENADYSIVYEDTTSTNVGNYNVTLTLNSTNYKWNDTENGLTRTLTYSIEKAILSWNDFTFRFNGTEMTTQSCSTVYGTAYTLTIEPKANASFAVLTAKYTGNGYDSEDQPTNAGTYTVSFTENSDNYDVGGEAIKLTLTIAKANLTLTATVDYTAATEGYYYENELDSSMLKDITTASATGVRGEEVTGNLSDGRNLTFNGDNSTFTVTFTPNNANYNATDITVPIKLKGVAYIGSTYYGTIEAALAAATSGQTVYVVPDVTGKVIVKEDCEVKTGVTLILPYDVNGGYNANATATESGGGIATPDKMITSVILDAKVTVNGTIIIAGVLSGGGGGTDYSGQTSGNYAELVLTSSAELSINGEVKCYGFIHEQSKNNGSQVTVNKDGKLYMPFILRDFRGGAYMNAVYSNVEEKHIAPFNQFEMRNVTALLYINFGGRLYGCANLYAGEVQNATEIKIIDSSSDSLLQLTDSKYSYVTAKYDESTEICNLRVYGGATLNAMSMKIEIFPGLPIPVSTQEVYFPLTWRYHITLDNHEEQSSDALFYMSKRYKLMTGSVFTVEEGASLTVGELMLYETFTDTCKDSNGGWCSPYPLKGPANFTVNGKLIVNTAIGGRINTNGNGQVTINSGAATTLITEEATEVSGKSIASKLETTQSIKNVLALKKYSNAAEDYSTAGTYYGARCADGTFGWYPAKVSISYEVNGGNTIAPVTRDTSPNRVGYTISDADLPTPTKTGTEFLGWYLDADCTDGMEANGKTIYADTILYAKWSKQTFIVNFASEVDGNVDFNKTVSDLAQGTTISSDQFPTIDHSKYSNNVTYQYFYTGSWYYYENGVKVPFTSETRIDRNLTVYAEYEIKHAVNLRIRNADINTITVSGRTVDSTLIMLYLKDGDTIQIKATSKTRGYNLWLISQTSTINISSNAGHEAASDSTGSGYASATTEIWSITKDTIILIQG